MTDRADPVRNGRLPHLPQAEAGAQSEEGTCPGFIGLTGNADLLVPPLDPPFPLPTRRGDSEGGAETTEMEGEDRPSLRLSLWAESGPSPGAPHPPAQDTYPRTAE